MHDETKEQETIEDMAHDIATFRIQHGFCLPSDLKKTKGWSQTKLDK
ncbi:MAG: hypothetical protein GY804_01540 [Alphaproteobacteria bacterium]|nr:hypothetical protein [Alphaproteobacteria bacterium]